MPTHPKKVGMSKEYKQRVAENIHRLREQQGVTQLDLAIKLDISPAKYYRIEAMRAGNKIFPLDIDLIEEIAKHLKVPVEEILKR